MIQVITEKYFRQLTYFDINVYIIIPILPNITAHDAKDENIFFFFCPT